MSPHRVRLTLYAVSLIESILLLLSFRLILRIKPLLGKVYIMHGDNSEGEVAVIIIIIVRDVIMHSYNSV